MRHATLCAGITLALLTATAQAGMYRWVDKNGRVHYSDTPPPPTASQVEEKKLQSNVVSGDVLPYSVQVASKNFPVTLYSSKDCGKPCADGRDLLVKRGVPFKEVAISDAGGRELLKRVSDSNVIPVLSVGKDVREGYLASTWHAALDSAGYPKSGSVHVRPRVQTNEATKPSPAQAEEEAPSGPYAPNF